ncbi:ethylene-responsive transcription factor erf118 [Phtheirospermum japonicum]|uniref:Ethylene-responsive transcription factor erf118 n=1 Tax=Phtheirospermum japonicum TaxID=374723 RepID=A0A830BCB6_9LAMI|nr:ethylene-responsive transcription factor erf118 [Phtheirospermum japonicum]
MDNFTTKTRKIRILFSDPDATDSSSDELDPSEKKSRRIIHEIDLIQKVEINPGPEKKSPVEKKSNFLGAKKRIRKFVGVRIRDPIQKRRVWLGTFTTAEEASRAYNSKKSEFEEMLRAKRGFSWVPCEEKSSDLKSPTSVLEIDTAMESSGGGGGDAVEEGASGENEAVENPKAEELGFFRGVQIVDENGFFMGDFSKLDDLSICADEHGVILA